MNGPYRPGDVVRFPVTSDIVITAIATNAFRRNGATDGTVTVTYTGSGKLWYGSYTIPGGYAPGDAIYPVLDVTAGSTYTVPGHEPLVLVQWPATALPNAAAAAANGLPTVGTGTGQISPSGGGVGLSTAGAAAVVNRLRYETGQ